MRPEGAVHVVCQLFKSVDCLLFASVVCLLFLARWLVTGLSARSLGGVGGCLLWCSGLVLCDWLSGLLSGLVRGHLLVRFWVRLLVVHWFFGSLLVRLELVGWLFLVSLGWWLVGGRFAGARS